MLKRFVVLMAFLKCICSVPALSADEKPDYVKAVLAAKGKPEKWMTGSEQIRKHLEALDYSDAKVKRFLPAIERRCNTLMKLGKIYTMQRATFTQYFEAMLEDLVKGEKVLARYAGRTINYGYWSKHIGRMAGTKVQVPPGFDSDKEYQFFMYYKLGGGMYWRAPGKKWAGPHDEGATVSGPYRPTAEMCQNTPETFHAWSALNRQVKGRQGLVEELKELTHALCQDFSVSPDRVFLSGYSDGGFSALWLASRYPHLVAGIAPGVANWQYGNTGHFSFFNFATLVVDGWGDGGYLQENMDRFTALNNMGYDISGLLGHHGHDNKWLETEETVKKMMAWAKSKRRNLNRKHIKFATWNLAWNRAFWFSIEEMKDPLLAAFVDAKIEGNAIQVKARNIAAYKIDLNEKLVDMKAPVKVFTNGALSYDGPCQKSVLVDLLKERKSKIVKNPRFPGGMTVVAEMLHYADKKVGLKNNYLPRPRTWLKFTGGDNPKAELGALRLAGWMGFDKNFKDADLNKDLYIYGGPLRNTFTAKIADQLPIKFEKGKFTIGRKVYGEPQHWVKFLIPNPLNPKKFCLINAFNDPITAAKEMSLGMGIGAWGFRDGDCRVYGVRKSDAEFNALKDKYKKRKGSRYKSRTYMFDSNWQAYDRPPIGTAEKAFAWKDILQLKANAIKEQMGVDAGLYLPQPGYLMWNRSLDKGPITLHDIAVTHPLPEFIMTCELSGAQLKGFVENKGVFHTVFSDKEGPGYDPKSSLLKSEIDDAKMYKVAAGYSFCDGGRLGVSWDRNKMPKPHFYFESVKAFTDHEGGGIRSKNLIQTETEVTEAVVAYIKKRGKVTPGVK